MMTDTSVAVDTQAPGRGFKLRQAGRVRRREREPAKRPLFRTVNDAMRYAFRQRDARPLQSSHLLVPLMQKQRLEKDGPADAPVRAIDPSLDRIPPGLAGVQASMLQNFVRRQSIPRNLHLFSKYSHGEERRQAQRALRDFLIPLLRQTIKPRFLIFQCVCRYYDRREMTFTDLACRMAPLIEKKEGETSEKHMRRAWRQVRELSREVDSWLQQIGMQSEDAAYSQLEGLGVVG